MDHIFHRTSIRRYQEIPVEEEKIELLMRAAMAAPSAGNQQPWEFYVVTDQEVMTQLSECSIYAGFTAKAALIIVPCYRTDGIKYPQYALIDLSAAVENILLEADSLALGATWCGIAPEADRMEKVKAVLNIPEGLEAFAFVSVGYPAETKHQQDRYDESRIHRI